MFLRWMITLMLTLALHATDLQHAKIYVDQNISGWMMSEKYDGIRAYWDTKELRSKSGKLLHPPQSFLDALPPFSLDGELWIGRQNFEELASIVLDKEPSKGWGKVRYMIFEVPLAQGNFLARLAKAERYIQKHKPSPLHLIQQHVCSDAVALEQFLDEVVAKGGEGVMVKDGSLAYFSGRSSHLLKVKRAHDMEGIVVGYKEGKGKYSSMVGSLLVELADGQRFYLGGGLSDALRKDPPSLGSRVTFKYYGFTKKGKPKFASFMRVRVD